MRRTTRSPQLAALICHLIASGRNLTGPDGICRQPIPVNASGDLQDVKLALRNQHMPSAPFVFKWLSQDRQFAEDYVRACKTRASVWAEQLLTIADSATPENAHAVRLKCDVRKWLMSKQDVKKYGDASIIMNTGNTTNNIVLLSTEQQQQLREQRLRILGGDGASPGLLPAD